MSAGPWSRHDKGDLVRCPAFTQRGERCGKAQDRAGVNVTVYIRVAHGPITGGLERVCRGCGTRLEVAIEQERASG
jgi:hypothetical protein